MKMRLFLIGFFIIVAFNVNAALEDTRYISISLVNQDPDPAIAGDVVELRFGIENKGGVAVDNLILEVEPEYPFSVVPGEESVIEVGSLNAYQDDDDMKIVKVKIRVDRDASAGSYELKLKEYEKGASVVTQKSISIDVKNRENAEVIHIDKTTIIPGQESELKFTINNVGNAPLRDLSFKWENEDQIILPVGSDNTKYVKYIDIGEGAELSYKVIADTNADPGLYKLDLMLTYDDPLTGEEKEVNTIAGVYIGGSTDFDVAFSESSNGEISFSVANIGSNPAYSVSIIVPKQDGWRVSGSDSVIIGNLNKGDYTVASFSLQSTAARAQLVNQEGEEMTREEMIAARQKMQDSQGESNNVKIQIAYTDTMGKRTNIEKEVQLNSMGLSDFSAATAQSTTGTYQGRPGSFATQESTFSKYKWQIIIVVVVLLAFFGYRVYKKKKLVDPAFNIKKAIKNKK